MGRLEAGECKPQGKAAGWGPKEELMPQVTSECGLPAEACLTWRSVSFL